MVSNQSEVMNLINIVQVRFGILPSDTMFFLSVLFCAGIGILAIGILKDKYAILCCLFMPITFCVILGFIPIVVYIVICAMLAIYLSKIFSGGV
jgi:hypothetical protein